MSLLVSLTKSKVNSLQLFQNIEKTISWSQSGAKVGHRSVGDRSLLLVVAREKGVIASLSVEKGRKP